MGETRQVEPGVVVAAALVDRGRLLAARRTSPPEAAGRWELPGGTVEPGETLEQAVVREVAEELRCDIRPVRRLDGAQPLAHGRLLRVVLAGLVGGEPVPHEHDAVWWLSPGDLDRVRWLRPDAPFVAALRRLLRTS